MEAHLALIQPTQKNKITTSYEICSGPHDTQTCMENPEQAFVEYASSRTDEAGGKWYTFKPKQNNLGDTYNPSWGSHPNLRWKQPQNSQNNFSNPPNRFQPNSSISNRPFNNRPQNFNNQSNIEGLVFEFMASQDARLSRFKADFKQQQREMTNKIDTILKAITNQIAGTLPSDMVKNSKLGTHPVLSARSHPTTDPQCSTQIHSSINTITIHPKQTKESQMDESNVELEERNLRNTNFNPQSDQFASIATEQEPQNENPNVGEEETAEEPVVEYFDMFPTRDELTYHRYLMSCPIPLIFLRNPIITEGCHHNLKIPCNIRHVQVEKTYIDLNSPLNVMTRTMYNWIIRRRINPREDANGGISNFMGRIRGMHVFIGNFTYIVDFMIVEDISSIIDPRLSQVELGRPFVEISNMTHDPPDGVVRFVIGSDEVSYKIPHKIEQYDSLSDLEKEYTKSVYLRNEEDKRRGVDYVMSKILGFYKECLELGPEYLTGVENEGEVT
ncbi:hypothetical protein Tco_0030725 [Tanacetum coccineum]